MVYVDNSQITPLYANTSPGLTADAGVVDPAIAAMIVAINTNADIYTAFITALELPIPDQSIVTRHLRNLAVTNSKLAALAVTADKLADGSITLAKLADLVVTAAKIANYTISEAKLADDSVSRRTIQAGAVGANEIDPTILNPISDATINIRLNQIGIVDITSFGAISGGNSTMAINNAINSIDRGKVIVPDGTYYIDTSISILMKSNVDLELTDNAILKAIPTSTNAWRRVVMFNNVNNSKILGGSIYGERDGHFEPVSGKVWEDNPFLPSTVYAVGDIFFRRHYGYICTTSGTTSATVSTATSGTVTNGTAVFNVVFLGEDGHCVEISNGINVTIEKTKMFNALGDGVFAYYPTNENLQFLGIETENCKRQGVSVIYSKNMVFRDCTFRNTDGDPGAGIDIEPNIDVAFEAFYPTNTMIENCTFEGNNWGVLLANLSTDTIIKDCKFYYNLYNVGVSGAKNVKIINCDFYSETGNIAGVYIYGTSDNVIGENNRFYGVANHGIWVQSPAINCDFISSNFDNFHANDNVITDETSKGTLINKNRPLNGGRNLLINTNKESIAIPKSTNANSTFPNYTAVMTNGVLDLTHNTSGGYARFNFTVDDEYRANENYIISFLGKSDAAVSITVEAYYNTASATDIRIGRKIISTTTAYKRIEFDFKLPSTAISAFISFAIATGSKIYMKDIMLENATIPSEYRPSADDLVIKKSGTFTPSIVGSTTPGTPTYSARQGYYEKIGNVIYASCYVQITAKGGMVGSVTIDGLPFMSKNVGFGLHGGSFSDVNGVTLGGLQLVARLLENSNKIGLRVVGDATNIALAATAISDSALIALSITYTV